MRVYGHRGAFEHNALAGPWELAGNRLISRLLTYTRRYIRIITGRRGAAATRRTNK